MDGTAAVSHLRHLFTRVEQPTQLAIKAGPGHHELNPCSRIGGRTGRQFRKVEGGPWGPDSSQGETGAMRSSSGLLLA